MGKHIQNLSNFLGKGTVRLYSCKKTATKKALFSSYTLIDEIRWTRSKIPCANLEQVLCHLA